MEKRGGNIPRVYPLKARKSHIHALGLLKKEEPLSQFRLLMCARVTLVPQRLGGRAYLSTHSHTRAGVENLCSSSLSIYIGQRGEAGRRGEAGGRQAGRQANPSREECPTRPRGGFGNRMESGCTVPGDVSDSGHTRWMCVCCGTMMIGGRSG